MDSVWISQWWPSRPARSKAVARPSKPKGPPIFIYDAVTPWHGETLLLSLLRAQRQQDQDE